MPATDDDTTPTVEADPAELILQARSLVENHDSISRVIRDLNLPIEELPDKYDEEDKTDKTFDYEAILRVFLYWKVSDHSQAVVADRLRTWPHLRVRFGLDRAPSQPTISHVKRRRLPRSVRSFLDTVAEGIREAAHDHDIRSKDLASPDEPDPSELIETNEPLYKYIDQHAPGVIETLLEDVMPAFDTGRAENAKYADKALWEQQTLMSLTSRAGTPSAYRTFNKFHRERPHNDTHVRAVKKLGTPAGYQFTFDDFATPSRQTSPVPEWRRITETIQSQFSDAIDRMLGTVRQSEMFTEPLAAAIDITGIPYHVTPYKGEDDIEPGDEEVVVDEETGRTRVPKDEYPEMVNGTEYKGVYEYQYATLSIIGRNAPLVVAVEPIKASSKWTEDDESVSYAGAVDRLMDRATELLDIHLVMAEKAFDSHGVQHVLDQKHDVTYLIPKKENSDHLREQAAEVLEDPTIQARVEQDAPLHLDSETPYIDVENDSTVDEDGYSHDVTFMHVPADRDDWIIRNADDTGYAIFITNRDDVAPLDAEGLVNRYSDR
jgi:hypothetical protein